MKNKCKKWLEAEKNALTDLLYSTKTVQIFQDISEFISSAVFPPDLGSILFEYKK